ncbi:restriction endonuclease subunit S [Aggregatibacter sp. Marseille-P9115]|uniref:restriction endonuclease subunit S n=1 Tax=Aggregatibacter sp. Marseille-P9115 TaxID=2866570 RepID=UPI001E2DB520|nr:restriction endonuclease subunit S [Aggregatibacter sp. Marseille-P9115]
MKEDVLPEGWMKTTLEYLGKWGSGGTPNRKYKEYYEGDISWVKTGDLGEKYLFKSSEYISKLGLKNSSAKMFPKGAIVLAMYGATIGKVSILDIEASTNQACAVIIPNENIDTEFLYYFLLSQKDIFIKKGKGGAQPNISQAIIKEHDINLPPLPEQQYLSQKLTALLDEVAQTKQRLEAIPALLKQFSQSVLADAVSGRLTDSDKYKDHKLKDYFDFIDGDRGPNYPKKDEYSDKGYCLFLSTKNVREFGFDFSECIYISQEKDSVLRKGKLNRGDVIITTRGTLGNVASYDEKVAFDNVRINSGMLILRKKENNILNEYSKILIASPLFKQMITDKQTGSAQPQLPAGILKEFEVPIPSIEEQTQIVQKVETYFALADEIEAQVNAALENVNLLTQSILAKVFSGELSAAWRNSKVTETQGNV